MNMIDYETMTLESITLPEDNSRLYYNLCKCPKPCQLLFLGGSITSGYAFDETIQPFPMLIQEMLKLNSHDVRQDTTEDTRQDTRQFTVHNYGYSCFHTHLGIALLDQVLAELTPDIIALEYAVNNSYDLDFAASFEGMIQKLLQTNPAASIFIICTCDEHGYSCESYMAEIARHYNLPVISLSKALNFGQNHNFMWRDYSADHCHPTQNGQQLIADCIWRLFTETKEHPPTSMVTPMTSNNPLMIEQQSNFFSPKQPCFSNDYANATFYPAHKVTQLGGFKLLAGKEPFCTTIAHVPGDGRPMHWTVSCKRAYLLYEQSCDEKSAGRIEVQIASSKALTIDGYSIYGWDNPSIALLFHNETKEQQLTIRMVATDLNKTFRIYGFLVT